MKRSTMRLLLFLLIVAGLVTGLALMNRANAQAVQQEPPLRIYRGNVGEKALYLPAEDVSKTVTVTTYYQTINQPPNGD